MFIEITEKRQALKVERNLQCPNQRNALNKLQ
jgi:hypothetical protein